MQGQITCNIYFMYDWKENSQLYYVCGSHSGKYILRTDFYDYIFHISLVSQGYCKEIEPNRGMLVSFVSLAGGFCEWYC